MTSPGPGPTSDQRGDGAGGRRMDYPSPPDATTSATRPEPAAEVAPAPRSVDPRWRWDGRSWLPVPNPAPPWLAPYQSAHTRATWAMVGLAVEMAVALPVLVSFVFGPDLVLLLLLLLPALTTVGISALMAVWACRCFRNVGALGAANLRWSPGWAACGWFVPLANLAIPYLVVRELWVASAGGGRPPALVLAWGWGWIARIALIAALYCIVSLYFIIPQVSYLSTALGLAIFAVVVISSDVLSVLLVYRLTALQGDRARQAPQLGEAPLAAWARPYARTRTHAIWAAAAIAVAALAGLVMLLVNVAVRVLTGLPLEAGPPAAIVTWVEALAVSSLASLAAGPVAVALWVYRAYRNLPVLGSGPPRWSPGWAAGGWFVPVANFVLPYLVVSELWAVSRPSSRRTSVAVAVWWAALVAAVALWLASLLNYLVIGGSGQIGEDAVGILGDAALVVAAVLAVLGIMAITRGQQARAATY